MITAFSPFGDLPEMRNHSKATYGVLKDKERQEIWMFHDIKVRFHPCHMRGVFANGTRNIQSLTATPSSSPLPRNDLVPLPLVSQLNREGGAANVAHI